MATPKTVRTYPLNGSQKDFTIPFEYLARKFVVVTLIGVNRKELVLNTDYRFTTPTQITTTIAWGTGQGYDLIEIRRLTSATDRLVDFADGSILRAYDLNTSQIQSLHIAEEARDLTADTIAVNNDGNLDARAKRIVNVADAVDDGDAVNLRQQKAWAGSALNQAQAAAASATASANSATASATARTGSETARTGSEAARDLALQYRNTAETHKNDAAISATNSENSNVLSQAWASKPEDAVVSGGLYSSFHYSRKSAASASAASASASASADSAVTSGNKADIATQQADRAEGYASGLSLPSASGNALKVLRQKSDASGLEYVWGLDTIRAQLLGTVSQASGIPTGAVIEHLESGGKTLTRWADGTQICTEDLAIAAHTVSAGNGSLFNSSSFGGGSFLKPFISAPTGQSVTARRASGTPWAVINSDATTTNMPTFFYFSPVVLQSTTGSAKMIAIGRWF